MRALSGAPLRVAMVVVAASSLVGCSKYNNLKALKFFKNANKAYQAQDYREAAKLYKESLEADVDAAVAAAAAAFPAWSATTPGERSLALLRLADALEAAITNHELAARMQVEIPDDEAENIRKVKEKLANSGEPMDPAMFVERMAAMNLPQSVFVDCTSSEDVAAQYADIIRQSISIVTPNKLANSGTYKQYRKLHDLADQHNVRFLYETNVGAGLPVINTLNSLITSGDRILSIEAVLSGTLSFIFNTFRKGVSFASTVKEARERGYTEPDPRIDLSGKDVARKLLILGRETGLQLEMKDISIDQILPPNCLRAKTVNDFMKELQRSDKVFEAMSAKAEAKGRKLRFIARLENGKASVVLKEVDDQHPFYHLSGSDNIISFRTERYNDRPLVVKGPGAGAAVTAAGVFADIISIGNYFDRG